MTTPDGSRARQGRIVAHGRRSRAGERFTWPVLQPGALEKLRVDRHHDRGGTHQDGADGRWQDEPCEREDPGCQETVIRL